MKPISKLIVALLALAGSFWAGTLSKQNDRLLVEGLYLPDYLTSNYPEIKHISKEGPFNRTVTKDHYIEWLETAIVTVRSQEQKKAIEYGNDRVSEMLDFVHNQTTPATIEEIKNKYVAAYIDAMKRIKNDIEAPSIYRNHY